MGRSDTHTHTLSHSFYMTVPGGDGAAVLQTHIQIERVVKGVRDREDDWLLSLSPPC